MKERKIIQSSKSWRDLDRTIKKLIKNKQTTLAGSIFEHLTKLYFEVSPEYKTKLSKVYLLNEVPNVLKKKLKLLPKINCQIVIYINKKLMLKLRDPRPGLNSVAQQK